MFYTTTNNFVWGIHNKFYFLLTHFSGQYKETDKVFIELGIYP